jgi:membrane protein implicated in regulation of membrane protease activity
MNGLVLAWVLLAVGLVVVEVLTLALVALMLAAGAVSAAVAAALGAPLPVDALVGAAVAAAGVVAVRPVALRHLRQGPEQRTGVAALVGRQAVVLERVDEHGGLVKLGGEVWTARSYAGSGSFEPGETVDVAAIEGATAVVL